MNNKINTLIGIGVALLMGIIYIISDTITPKTFSKTESHVTEDQRIPTVDSLKNTKYNNEFPINESSKSEDILSQKINSDTRHDSVAIHQKQREAELRRDREQQRIRRQARVAIAQLNLFSRREGHINLDKLQEEIDKINSSRYTHFEDNEKAIILERLKELNEIHRASFTFRTIDKALIENLNAKKILIHYKNHGKHITNGQKKYIDKVIKGEVVDN